MYNLLIVGDEVDLRYLCVSFFKINGFKTSGLHPKGNCMKA